MSTPIAIQWDDPVETPNYLNEILRRGSSINTFIGEQEKDTLDFMKIFDFPPLDQVKKSLLKSNIYEKEQIDELVSGLATLSEYQNNS